jgi:hypothetical protein
MCKDVPSPLVSSADVCARVGPEAAGLPTAARSGFRGAVREAVDKTCFGTLMGVKQRG